jgi:DNA helicase-2/ATP-dependent DNA helicase PcrA
MQDYIKELNPPQREAVLHTEGPLMIVAGAGSGKTKVLTTRIAHLINNDIDPFRILALTFTNKAAKEMKERIEKILGNASARSLFIGTFHSIFARILRAEAPQLGYPSNFTIYDTDDAKSVIKGIVKGMNLDDKLYKANIVYNRISAAKNSLYHYEDYQADSDIQKEDLQSKRPKIGKIFEYYSKQCFKNGAMDFDDLLVLMYTLLTTNPEALSKYQHKFRYILIDEYQDTNTAQYHIIKLLGARHENICVVGDDAQSIYSFRGASVKNIFMFQKDYEDVKVIKLEQNYRSTKSILMAANAVIEHNSKQIKKELWTDKGDGNKLKLICTFTDNDEGKFVAETIKEEQLRNHFKNQDYAILYRTNAQSRSFEENLRRHNIPYRIYGGLSFYQRKEIKDFVAYLRVIVNSQDQESLKRIINYPTRGIGKTSTDKITVLANDNNITFWEVLERIREFGFTGRTANSVEAFVMMIKSFRVQLEKKNAYDVAEEVGKATGIVKELYKAGTVEDLSRYENVQELLNAIKEFTETPDDEGELLDKSLGSYLQQITLLTDADKEDPENQDVVTLMTIHASKGLEFPNVFVVGTEENLFPSQMSMYDKDDLEEERRLFYVAITRAEQNVWLTYANHRYRFGQLVSNEPSRFLEELPEAYVDVSKAKKARNKAQAGERPRMTTFINQKKTSNPNLVKKAPSDPSFVADSPSDMEQGMKVKHQRFGIGTIENLEGPQANRIATISFGGLGNKKIMLNYAKLKIMK